MNILVVGHASHEKRQFDLFLENGFKKDKVVICAPNIWGKQKIQKFEKINLKIIPLNCKRSGNISQYFLFGLNKIADKFKPDLIYYQGEPWSLMALKCARLSKMKKIPLFIYTFENLKRVYQRRDNKFFGLNKFLEKMVYKNSKLIVGNKEARKIIKQRGFFGKTFLLPISGINEKIFFPKKKKEKRKKLKLLFVGRIVKEKGIEDILEALFQFSKLNKNFEIVFVGSGKDLNYLRKKTFRLNLQKQVKFVGQKEYSSIPKYMQESNIFLYPSRKMLFWEEQFGFSIPEALSCGCEVISTKTGAISEWFGKWVWLVNERKPSQIKDFLVKITQGKKRNTYKGEYSMKNIAKELNTIFKNETKK